MELNKTTKTQNTVTMNPEGSIVNSRRPEIQLYLESSNLNIKNDSFYVKANDKLNSVINLANMTDKKFVLGLSKFLTDNGLKLSPVVLLSSLANNKFSFDGQNIKTFNTPQRIAEAISLENNDYLKLNNSFKKHVLKKSLEGMGEFTLRKNKMRRKKVKLKDLIKLLRPDPKKAGLENGELYKSIIEDGLSSKFKENESLISVKSSTNMIFEQKKEYYKNNIKTIPINMLIRNLKWIVENCDWEESVEMQKQIIEKLNNIKNFRFLNIFNIITTCIYVPQLEQALFEVIKRFANDVKNKFNYNQDATVLFDFSGSMYDKPLEVGFKYLVLLSLVFNDIQLRVFTTSLYDKDLNGQIQDIKKGMINRAWKQFKQYMDELCGGTALIQSTEQLLEQSSDIKNLIIISDEVSWVEGGNLIGDISTLDTKLSSKNVILINPEIYKGTVFKNNIVAMSGLTSSIIYNVMLLTQQVEFINYIKEYGVEECTVKGNCAFNDRR